VSLFTVSPGDHVSAALILTSAGWRVSIMDASSGMRKSFRTRDDSHGAFNLAEWLQEDPTKDSDGAPEPYPQLGSVRFTHPAVNGTPTRYATVDSQWMSVNSRDFAPTPLSHSTFIVTPTALTTAGSRYLKLVSDTNRTQSAFEQATLGHTATAGSSVQAQARAVVRGLTGYSQGLAHANWPQAAEPSARRLTTQADALSRVVEAAEKPLWVDNHDWRDRYQVAALAMSRTAHRLRRLLHLPEIGTAAQSANAG